MTDEGYESFATDDFVDFSNDLRKILKTIDTRVEHWLSQDSVEALNEALKGELTHPPHFTLSLPRFTNEVPPGTDPATAFVFPPDARRAAFIVEVSESSIAALESEKKNIIQPSHIVEGLRAKGFGDIADDLERDHPKLLVSGRKKKKDDGGMTDQEALELQQKLFAQAKARQAM